MTAPYSPARALELIEREAVCCAAARYPPPAWHAELKAALGEIGRLELESAATDDQCVRIYMGLHVSQTRRIPLSVQAMWQRGQSVYTSRVAHIKRTAESVPLAIDANATQTFGGRKTARQSRIDIIGQNGNDGEHYEHLEDNNDW